MSNSNLLILAACGVLDIKKPVEVRMNTKAPKGTDSMAGYCMPRYRKGKVIRHMIHINLRVCVESSYSLDDVVLHEICHAAQFEHGIFDWGKHHDKKFRKLCKVLEIEMPKLGYAVGKLFNSKTDKT